MHLDALRPEWTTTRSSLQHWAQALTAFPRAEAPHDPRWTHVSMVPTSRGLAAATFALADGTTVSSEIDLDAHRIEVVVGDRSTVFDLATEPPSPRSVGTVIADHIVAAGGSVVVDEDRFANDAPLPYDPLDASAFWASARTVVEALDRIRMHVDGETTGPHLWPHGFDIALEWYSPRLVDYDGSEANAQIAFGWYPGETQYLYVNPWPFDESFGDIDLPSGATWHRDGWHGAELTVGSEGIEPSTIVGLATAVYDRTETVLRS